MGVGDHQFDATQPAPRQALQKARPEGLGLRRADMQPDDFAPAVGVGRDSDYCRDRHDAAALALLQVSRVEPQIRPLAGERPVEEGMDALVNLLAQLRNLRLADPRQPHRLHQIVDPPGRHAANPGLLDHRDQRLLRALAGFQKRREVAPAAASGCAIAASQADVESAVAVAVAPGGALATALIPPAPIIPWTSPLHQQLQHRLCHGLQKISIAGLLQQIGQHQSLFGHRVLSRASVEVWQLHLSRLNPMAT